MFRRSAAKKQNVSRAFQEPIWFASPHENTTDDVMGIICELLAR
jgi:hypothetical protein